MSGLVCINCPEAVFLDPKKEVCWKTGGLLCKRLEKIVGKYDQCHVKYDGTNKKRRAR